VFAFYQSYVTTHGQSSSLSWCKTPIWGPRRDYFYCHTVSNLLTWAPSLTRRWVCRLQLLLVLASAVILRSDSRRILDHFLLSQIRYSPYLEGQVTVFISPRNRVALLYPQALGSLFVASYNSQSYDVGIGTRLHAGTHCITTVCFTVWGYQFL
jgi:hypothetical protein